MIRVGDLQPAIDFDTQVLGMKVCESLIIRETASPTRSSDTTTNQEQQSSN